MVRVHYDKINYLLKSKGYEQSKLCEILKWKQPTVSAKLSGNRKLKVEELFAISRILNVSMEDLLIIENI